MPEKKSKRKKEKKLQKKENKKKTKKLQKNFILPQCVKMERLKINYIAGF